MVLKDGDGGLGHVTGDDGGYASFPRKPYLIPDFFTDLRRAVRTRKFANVGMAKLAVIPLCLLAAILLLSIAAAVLR